MNPHSGSVPTKVRQRMKPDGILRSSVFRPPSSTLRRTLPLCPLGDAIPCICFCSHEAPSRNMLPVDAKWAAHLEMLYLGAYYCLLFCFPFWMAASGTSPMNHRGKASPSNRFVKCRFYPHILSFSSMSIKYFHSSLYGVLRAFFVENIFSFDSGWMCVRG